MDDNGNSCPSERLIFMGRVGRLVAVMVAVALGATACGSDGFTYVEHKDEGLFFRVPDEWIVSESRGVLETPTEELTRAIEGLNDPDLPALPQPWRVSIEAALPSGPGPSVLVEVIPIQSDMRDDLSVRSLKSMATPGVDPTSQDALDQGITILYDQDVIQGNLSGNRVVVSRDSESGGTFTVDQLVYVDTALTRLYRMVVLCDRACYLSNFDEIDDVMNSFTVES